MINIENIETMGWEHAIRGMRNPMNSWYKSDTKWVDYRSDIDTFIDMDVDNCCVKVIGENDLALMKRLRNAGTDHRKFMRMITVYMDITAPLYWWKEFDTYKVGTVANSCSTMHKIHEKEFTIDDFSHEHLTVYNHNGEICRDFKGTLEDLIDELNIARKLFIETGDKIWWWQMIQLLPSSYNQKRTVMLNYEVLANMYKSRKNHKLDEWQHFCKQIENLPYSEFITGEENNGN